MRAGQLDNKVVIEERTVTRTNNGAPVQAWTEFAVMWADAESVPGRKGFDDNKENPTANMRFSMRYIEGVNTTMRINYDGQFWYIYDKKILGRRMGLEIYAQAKGVAAG